MEEEAPAVHSVSLQLAKHGKSFLAAGTCSVKNFVCNFGMSSLLGRARGSRPSHTTFAQ